MDKFGRVLSGAADFASGERRRTERPPRFDYGTVKSVSGAKMTVEVASGSIEVTMTTACSGAKAGQRAVLLLDGPLATAIGVIS